MVILGHRNVVGKKKSLLWADESRALSNVTFHLKSRHHSKPLVQWNYCMRTIITPTGCYEEGAMSESERSLDKERSKFVLWKKIRHRAGRRKLGILWLLLDPIVTSLVYLFVFCC